MATDLKELKQQQTAVAKKEPPRDFPAMLTAWKGEIAHALPKHLNADRMGRIALTCFRQTPKLAECDPRSVFAAVIQGAQLGLEPGLMGEAHLVPYGSQCQLIPGYQGLIKLAKQTGQVVDIYAVAVREKDRVKVAYGTHRELEHEPLLKNGFPASDKERGEIVGFYAVAVFKDGTRAFELLGVDQVRKVRDESRGYQAAKKYKKDTPWDTHFEAMGCKTVIRKLCKYLPKSPELAQALELDRIAAEGRAQKIDLADALSGEYAVVSADDGAQGGGLLMTVEDVLKMVEAGDCDEAVDLARSIEESGDREGASKIRNAVAAKQAAAGKE
jgi:recombination protein RecT